MAILFTVRNNVDWTQSFQLLQGTGATPPWANVAPYTVGAVYQDTAPTSAVVQNGNLYVAGAGAGVFTAGAFDPTQWALVGSAAGYSATPVDLTGARIDLGMILLDSGGARTATRIDLSTAGSNPGLVISAATTGMFAFAYPAVRAKAVTPGPYDIDAILIRNAGAANETRRLALAGQGAVLAGAAR